MKFIAIDDEYQMHSLFPETSDLKTVSISHGIVLESFEECFVILIMGDQGGDMHWTVTHSQIDGNQRTESGSHSSRNLSDEKQIERLEQAINGAFEKLTEGWLPSYLPTN